MPEHFAIGLGDWENAETPVVRVHSECVTGDVFGSLRCDCGPQLTEGMDIISERGGFIIYLRQEGRGIGLYNKLDAYNLQDQGYDTYEANEMLGFEHDLRDFKVAADMLKAVDKTQICLFSNNNKKKEQLISHGISISDMLNTGVHETSHNRRYLVTKKEVGRHNLKFGN